MSDINGGVTVCEGVYICEGGWMCEYVMSMRVCRYVQMCGCVL